MVLKCKLNIGRNSWPTKHLLQFFWSFKMHHKTKVVSLQRKILAFFFMIAKKGNYECHENTLSSCILLTIEPLYESVQKVKSGSIVPRYLYGTIAVYLHSRVTPKWCATKATLFQYKLGTSDVGSQGDPSFG